MDILNGLLRYTGKDTLLPTTKRLLNFAFVLMISSKIFSHFYFSYDLNEWNDYESHFKFITNGNFLVPLSIYILIWSSTRFLGIYSIALLNYLITSKLKTKIINLSINRNEYYHQAEKINNLIKQETNIIPKKEWFITIYEILKKSISKDDYARLIVDLEKRKVIYENDFVLFIRSIVAICIIVYSDLFVGGVLLTLIMLYQLYFAISIIIKYQFSELFPIAIQKYSSEIDQYIRSNYPESQKTD